MNKNQETKEKICTFFASDYHFEMISLPYIDKNLEEDKEIIILTENNLEETINTLLGKMNFNEEKKNKFLKIGWKNDDLEKFKCIKENLDQNREMIIFIKGKENYIHNINGNIDKWIKNSDKIKLVDCYDIEEIGDNLDEIMCQYKKVLNTSGEKEIEKLM